MLLSRLFLLIGGVFAVAGCGGKADQQAPSTPPQAKAGSKHSSTVAGHSESGSGSTSKSDTPKAGPIEVFEQTMKAGGVVTVSKTRYEGYRLPDDKTMPHGKWQHFDPALEEEGRYEHGKRAKVESGEWKKGKKFGVWTFFKPDGSPLRTVEYAEGGVPLKPKR